MKTVSYSKRFLRYVINERGTFVKYAELIRNTKETQITMSLELDHLGSGWLEGSTGIGFFDHMLNSFCVHGGFYIKLNMHGDLEVDSHHTIEDVGIVLGTLFANVLADKSGIARFGEAHVPMDESLVFSAVDISGRPYLVYDVPSTAPMLGAYDTQMTKEFFRALAFNMGATLHIKLIYGENEHHITEAVYKSAARAISSALKITDNGILSTKGIL